MAEGGFIAAIKSFFGGGKKERDENARKSQANGAAKPRSRSRATNDARRSSTYSNTQRRKSLITSF